MKGGGKPPARSGPGSGPDWQPRENSPGTSDTDVAVGAHGVCCQATPCLLLTTALLLISQKSGCQQVERLRRDDIMPVAAILQLARVAAVIFG